MDSDSHQPVPKPAAEGGDLPAAAQALLQDAASAEAEELYRRALAMHLQAFGPEHADVAIIFNNLAAIEDARGNQEEAEFLYRRALEIREKALGPEDPQIGTSLNNLGMLHASRKQYDEAERCFRRAVAILEKTCGKEHPNTAICRANFAGILRDTGRETEADEIEDSDNRQHRGSDVASGR